MQWKENKMWAGNIWCDRTGVNVCMSTSSTQRHTRKLSAVHSTSWTTCLRVLQDSQLAWCPKASTAPTGYSLPQAGCPEQGGIGWRGILKTQEDELLHEVSCICSYWHYINLKGIIIWPLEWNLVFKVKQSCSSSAVHRAKEEEFRCKWNKAEADRVLFPLYIVCAVSICQKQMDPETEGRQIWQDCWSE